MITLHPYTAPSDIDQHRRDAAAITAVTQHDIRCLCQHCTDRRVWTAFENAAMHLRRAGGEASMLNTEAGIGPAWMGVRP